MKTSAINLRVDEITRDQLEKISKINGVTISTTIRKAVDEFLEDETILDPELFETKRGLHLVKTISFSEFIFWIYQKNLDPEIIEVDDLYVQIINLINECRNYPIFNPELMTELDKVSEELNRYLYDDSYDEYLFQFPDRKDDPFNYGVLEQFMFMLRYDSDNRKIIHCK